MTARDDVVRRPGIVGRLQSLLSGAPQPPLGGSGRTGSIPGNINQIAPAAITRFDDELAPRVAKIAPQSVVSGLTSMLLVLRAVPGVSFKSQRKGSGGRCQAPLRAVF
jgi:hypothetical protein